MDEEHVLVIPAFRLSLLDNFTGFRPFCPHALEAILNPEFMEFKPRSTVEDDPSFKQLIPYAIVETCEGPDKFLFQYTRGKGQGEKRLHALRSIGIGGHISREDAEEEDLYRSGMLRELNEELEISEPYTDELVGFIYDDKSAVGQVHLGIVHRLTMPSRNGARNREHELMESGFQCTTEIKNCMSEFETWSQLCITHLY